jgi:hypothetical protein
MVHVMSGDKTLSNIIQIGPFGMLVIPAASGIYGMAGLKKNSFSIYFNKAGNRCSVSECFGKRYLAAARARTVDICLILCTRTQFKGNRCDIGSIRISHQSNSKRLRKEATPKIS